MLIKEFNSPFIRGYISSFPRNIYTEEELHDDLGMYLAGGELWDQLKGLSE